MARIYANGIRYAFEYNDADGPMLTPVDPDDKAYHFPPCTCTWCNTPFTDAEQRDRDANPDHVEPIF